MLCPTAEKVVAEDLGTEPVVLSILQSHQNSLRPVERFSFKYVSFVESWPRICIKNSGPGPCAGGRRSVHETGRALCCWPGSDPRVATEVAGGGGPRAPG